MVAGELVNAFRISQNLACSSGLWHRQLERSKVSNYIVIEPGNRSYFGDTDNDIAVLDAQGRDIYIWEDSEGFFAVTDGQSWWTLYGFEEGILNNVGEEFAFDHNGPAVYRMYQAAFDRVPDVAGVGYWAGQLDDYGLSLLDVAGYLIRSAEFAEKFGHEASNEQFIQAMYQNVLGRDPDAGRYSYWTSMMDGGTTRESILLGFADSEENRVQVIEHMQAGEPWLIF